MICLCFCLFLCTLGYLPRSVPQAFYPRQGFSRGQPLYSSRLLRYSWALTIYNTFNYKETFVPIIKSAIKRMHQTAKRRARNVTTKKNLKGAVKAFMLKPTATGLQAAQSELDTAVKKNILKKNTASRRKAQLSKVAKNAGVKLTPAAKKTATKVAPKAAAKPAAKKAPVKAPVKKAVPAKKPVAKKAPAKKPAAKK